ncbi:hypothetical protein [Actomonas aquatica]|uniref:DUF4440 domain-containing protein n=1 Tax=Actomonas aquatica TaxID=2866162 RepID=A0ABZ1C5V2_9BACT|nr:hypothetical protein [Opitutus sp. WL0086]WRQ87025.1 hypothetical protein K1X11_019600 [Opitutus sp. WL0086]
MKNLRRSLLTLALCALSLTTWAAKPSADETAQIKADIDSMFTLFEKGDASALIEHTHDSIYKLVGSKEVFTQITEQALAMLKQTGIRFVESTTGEPGELYPAGDYELCFVPRTAIMEMQGQKLRTQSFMIAIRTKGESDWKYLDGSGLQQNPALLRTLFPELDESVETPAITVTPVS